MSKWVTCRKQIPSSKHRSTNRFRYCTEENDTSGGYLAEHAKEAGHNVVDKQIVIDDMYKIRAIVSKWIADDSAFKRL
ncbi:hypothetical protein O9929_10335 [Vibrio lentus]|nr:hypothetical protein [Vibrio lentus]